MVQEERQGPNYVGYVFVLLGSIILIVQINPFRHSQVTLQLRVSLSDLI